MSLYSERFRNSYDTQHGLCQAAQCQSRRACRPGRPAAGRQAHHASDMMHPASTLSQQQPTAAGRAEEEGKGRTAWVAHACALEIHCPRVLIVDLARLILAELLQGHSCERVL